MFQIDSYCLAILTTIYNWSGIGQKAQGSEFFTKRLPTECKVNDLLADTEYIKQNLEQILGIVREYAQSKHPAVVTRSYEVGHGDFEASDACRMDPRNPVTNFRRRRGVSPNYPT